MADLYLHHARSDSRRRFEKLVGDLKDAQALVEGRACVYATGSFGRFEAGSESDLDLFIVTKVRSEDVGPSHSPEPPKPLLKNVEEITLKYLLIQKVRENGIAEFDGGGRFLAVHTAPSFVDHVGSREDDYRNTLTGRMLMLLESKPIIGIDVYTETLKACVDRYFCDYEAHCSEFIPSYLCNDILRMWRTFCVNYEVNRNRGDSRNKIKNLKLKFSRMITCYSAIIYILDILSMQGTVHPHNIVDMASFTPTERLENLSFRSSGSEDAEILSVEVNQALELYSEFLELTHKPKNEQKRQYDAIEATWRAKSYQFGELLASTIDTLSSANKASSKFRRIILI